MSLDSYPFWLHSSDTFLLSGATNRNISRAWNARSAEEMNISNYRKMYSQLFGRQKRKGLTLGREIEERASRVQETSWGKGHLGSEFPTCSEAL